MEQYLLELINRARLDPLGEAKRQGIDLNQGLAAGTLNGTAKQVLAGNDALDAAAALHSVWMLQTDIFSHTGAGGSSPGDRIADQSYAASTWGENIAWSGSTGTVTLEGAIAGLHRGLFLSAGHRTNLLNGSFREVGLGAETGSFFTQGRDWNAAMLTEVFAKAGAEVFVTGVAYRDANRDRFYSLGEGQGGVTFRSGGVEAVTEAPGGYELKLAASATTLVTGQAGTRSFSLTLDTTGGNVKLDLVDGVRLETSGSITLGAGINRATLLGVAGLSATGNAAANVLSGNAGANALSGGEGNDTLTGGAGADSLTGGGGDDLLTGGAGKDDYTGGAGADTFVLTSGVDRVSDFDLGLDHIQLNDALWTGTLTAAEVVSTFGRIGTGEVVLDFGATEIHLAGLTSLEGLAATLIIV
ncbi:CAP domain-containing protein [Stagnihabitans tardus]|uniref:SCP domain-containing protein n=1 Tax=Stagnihabitans tardus TaxID=2699202 RepID=A0AAE4YCX1_9RHOB|nr:hypothetical protein [Stagnihabitans tardus]